MDMNMNMEDNNEMESEEVNQTLFIPKQDGYQLPDKGTAMISFEKVNEDETGCTINVKDIETESNDNRIMMEEDEDALDHADKYFAMNRTKGGGY